jgi:hypothetical protein
MGIYGLTQGLLQIPYGPGSRTASAARA